MYEAIALIVISGLLGVARLMGAKSIAFQAIAHVFVGGLFGAGFVAGDNEQRWFYLGLAIGLSVLEVFAFFHVK